MGSLLAPLNEPRRKWRRLLADSLLRVNQFLSSDWLSRRVNTASALVFAPHPDDEVLGCGGVIALKAQAGAHVKVIVMTDGQASHKALIAVDELVKMRRAEAEEAARQLGLVARDYLFLDFEDHQLRQRRDAVYDRVAEIIDRFQPDEIYCPHRHDGIADHEETNHIVRRAIERISKPVVMLEYPVWLWNDWPWTQGDMRYGSGIVRRVLGTTRDLAEMVLSCRARVDVGSVLPRKLGALAAYRSQMQRFNGEPRWPVLADVAGGEFLRRFETGVEIFRRTNYRS